MHIIQYYAFVVCKSIHNARNEQNERNSFLEVKKSCMFRPANVVIIRHNIKDQYEEKSLSFLHAHPDEVYFS